jgi:hypothetical protein
MYFGNCDGKFVVNKHTPVGVGGGTRMHLAMLSY